MAPEELAATPAPYDLPAQANTARLYAIVARASRQAVVFRRGPSKQVRLLLWDLDTDTVTGGQWFKGRIYERRCDLSPDGRMLVYFAASQRPPFRTWTAVSRPPFLSALALWPKGDAWGGGGLFAGPGLLELNHRPGADGTFPLAPGFQLPPGLAVGAMGDAPGLGEDHPVESRRLQRDGWTLDWHNGCEHVHGLDARFGWTFDPPLRWHRPVGRRAGLSLLLHALREKGGRWQVQTAVIEQGNTRRDLGRVDWADADTTGDVLYAAGGCLYRIRAPDLAGGPAVLVADLNAMRFVPVAPPRHALR